MRTSVIVAAVVLLVACGGNETPSALDAVVAKSEGSADVHQDIYFNTPVDSLVAGPLRFGFTDDLTHHGGAAIGHELSGSLESASVRLRLIVHENGKARAAALVMECRGADQWNGTEVLVPAALSGMPGADRFVSYFFTAKQPGESQVFGSVKITFDSGTRVNRSFTIEPV